MTNPPESIEIADIATIETADLIVESCGVHDIDGWNEESLIFLYATHHPVTERTATIRGKTTTIEPT